MLGYESKEYISSIGRIAEQIICLTDCYDEEPEEYINTKFYKPEYEDKENIVSDIKELYDKAVEIFGHINMKDLQILYENKGISLTEYLDFISTPLLGEKYDNFKTRNAARAVVQLAVDLKYLGLENDDKYKAIAGMN